ncbi:MAG: SPOR domain-containing protein [Pseudomonadota bacterium]
MATVLTDKEIDLRRKARRRLIGAIALALLAVVIVPMLLDSEPRPGSQDIDLQIPSPDRAGEFVAAMPAATPAGEPQQSVVEPVVHEPESTPAVPINGADTIPPPAKVTARQSRDNKPEQKISTNDSDELQKFVDQLPESKGEFAVQIGAFSNAETAKRELDKVKAWGLSGYTEKVGGNIRVRVGPYADREKANQTLQKLEAHGMHPVVVSTQ